MQAFAGFSMNHTLSQHVNLFVALAPVAFADNASGLLSLLANFKLDLIFQFFGVREFLPDATLLQKLAPGLCEELGWACKNALFWVAGMTHHLNETRIPVCRFSSPLFIVKVYTSETPAGTSVKNAAHWAQAVRGGDFQMYDYGCGILSCRNWHHYRQTTPPKYNLTRVNVPTALYYGEYWNFSFFNFQGGEDILADPADVIRLLGGLRPEIVVGQSYQASFAHLDYTWGVDANELVYKDALRMIAKYNH